MRAGVWTVVGVPRRLEAMNRTARRIVALAAAYVIGLQALLLPLSVAAGGFSLVLCSAQTSVGNAQSPVGHDNGCPCAAGCGMQCGAHALASPPQTVIALTLPRAAGLLLPPPIDAVPRPHLRGPQLARAPPAA
jgi:hypothetical protein